MKYLEVEKQSLLNNIDKVKERTDGIQIYAVLKGDAYGLGITEVAKILHGKGITRYAVTDVSEAQQLRNNGFITEQIFMLHSITNREKIETLISLDVVCTIGSINAAKAINSIAIP